MKRSESDGPTPAGIGTAMTGAHLVPVCRTVPSRRTAFGGAALFIVLSLAAVLFHHWRRGAEERRARARLSELSDHLLKDIGLSRVDVLFGKVASHKSAVAPSQMEKQ
jgi:uncharacterized protein YjiS (DUF1127 family)